MSVPARGLTDRQREFLEHLRRCAASGQTLSAYATEHGLEVRMLYDFKKRLVSKGVLQASRPAPRFVRAQVLDGDMSASIGACRVHLPNGAVVEFAGPPGVDAWRGILETVHALP